MSTISTDIDFAAVAIHHPPFHAVAGTVGRGNHISYAIAGLEPAVREAHRLVLVCSPMWRTGPVAFLSAVDADMERLAGEGPLAVVIALHDQGRRADYPSAPSGWAASYARGPRVVTGIGRAPHRGLGEVLGVARPHGPALVTGAYPEDPSPQPRRMSDYRQPAPAIPRLRRVAFARSHIDAIFAAVDIGEHTCWITSALGGDGAAHSLLMTGEQAWRTGAHAAVSL